MTFSYCKSNLVHIAFAIIFLQWILQFRLDKTTVLLLEHIPTKCSYAGIICNQMVQDKKDTARFKAPKTLSMKVL
jgi:hypothetical protein